MAVRALFIILLTSLSLQGWSQSFNDMAAAMTEQSLPLVNVQVNINLVTSNYFVPGNITIAERNDSTVLFSSYHCQVRQRGMLALSLPKKSFSIKLVDEQGEKLDANLLNLRTDNSWILDAMGYDRLRMRNRLCFDIWNQYSQTSWDTNYGRRNGTVGTMVEVFINGQYHGIYCLSDKVNRQLLNLRKARVNDDGSVTVKGLLYKGISDYQSTLTSYEEQSTNYTEWNQFELQYPDEYPSLQTWQPLMNLIDFNSQSDDQYFNDHLNEWYYMDNLVDYWILLVAFGLKDMPYKNTFLSTPDINFEHRYMITPWDMDACLGRGWSGSIVADLSTVHRLDYFAPFNRLVLKNSNGFRQKVAKRWFELIETTLSQANVESHITAIAQRYVESGAWQREYERWKSTHAKIGSNIYSEVQYVTSWYSDNIAAISNHLETWCEDYDLNSHITAHTITYLYNYLLGIDPTYYEYLDINQDGMITSTDVTDAYTILLETK